jgi:hypothetical protein
LLQAVKKSAASIEIFKMKAAPVSSQTQTQFGIMSAI